MVKQHIVGLVNDHHTLLIKDLIFERLAWVEDNHLKLNALEHGDQSFVGF